MNNPIKSLTRREWCLWLASLAVVLIANQITPELDPLTMTAALVGVTSLVFAAKGNVWSQVLMIVFSILYGVISFRFHYWGEMITYLGMTLPMAVWLSDGLFATSCTDSTTAFIVLPMRTPSSESSFHLSTTSTPAWDDLVVCENSSVKR